MTDSIESTPLYNSRITKNYVEYIQRNYPEIEIGPILDYAGITSYQLEDGAHWFTQEQVDRFQEILKEKIPQTNIPLEVGRQFTTSKTSGVVSQYVLGFVTPASAYSVLEKLQSLLTRACTIQTNRLGSGKLEVIARPNPGVNEKPYQCENRIGTYESIAKLFTNKLANIEHPTCLHRGGHFCRYIISWENTLTFAWKRIRNYSILAGLGLCSVLAFFLPGLLLFMAALSCAVIVTALSFYSKHVEVKELETNLKNQGETAKSLITETDIRYNNAMLIQEIGQAISVILDIDDLLKFIMEALRKRLDFDRGMIMLANMEKSRLVYTAGYGYNPEHEQYLTGIEFHLDNPDSRGPIVESYRKQIPVLVDNVVKVADSLSKRSRDFAFQMGTHGFINVPIVYEGESMGVLTVDNVHTKRLLSQTDVSILMGIAPQIAISINNARSYNIIRESEEKFRSLSENAPDIIYTIDAKGAFTYVNPAWERILGYEESDVIGRYFIDFTRKDDIGKFIRLFKQMRDDGETVRDYTGTMLHKDGSERFFSMSGTPKLDSTGRVIGAIGVFKDITDRKKLELQLNHAQKMEAVGTLAGGIAHDFNNLLMGIQGFASLMLLNADKTHANYEKLGRIEDLVKSGADLTRQLLGFARGGKYEIKTTDLNEIIDKTSNIFSRTHKDILIHQKYEKHLWTVEADRGQIEQVLLNLYVNAWQAMPGGGNLFLETSNVVINENYVKPFTAEPGQYVLISVRDSGTGMDEQTQKRIFEPFFTTKEMGRGTGLGLASAYGIVKGHKGIIRVESERGHGTTFFIYLPASDRKVTHNEQDPAEILRGGGTILLVEDEELIADVSQEILEELGYKVFVAHSGNEAIATYSEKGNEIDLLILDMIMPGIGVEETFDTLKSMNSDVRVILSSGYSINNRVRDLIERGCNGFIQKPYNIGALSKKVSEVLHNNVHHKNHS
jgi:PAS domain S-box-containing protein